MIDKKKQIEDIAKMYTESLVLYGVDIQNKWETATSQHMALQQAYMRGQSDAFKRMWIPCSEMLPEDSRSVLIYTKDGRIAEGCYTHEGLEWWQFRWNVRNPDVIAWMPFPEPYKER